MTGWILGVLAGLLIPPAASWTWMAVLWSRVSPLRRWTAFCEMWLAGAAGGGLVIMAVLQDLPYAAGNAAGAGLALVLWQYHRRRRDRAPRSYGAKSWARVRALVRRARQARRPRLVLRPIPGGA